MNIFVIPSWYPTSANPISGIFFREQTEYLAKDYPDINFGISTWGQSDQTLHISKNNLSNLLYTINKLRSEDSRQKNIFPNLTEYYHPCISWTPKLFKGNIKQVVKANLVNFKAFSKQVGKVDLIHAHVGFPGGHIAMAIAKQYGIPYIITEHMAPFPFPQFETRKGELKSILSKPLINANKLIAVSPALANTIARYGLESPLYIPNVVAGDFFQPGANRLPDNFTFFTLCILSPQKGILDLLHAAKILIARYPQVQLRIGGGGPQFEELRSHCVKLGIQGNVNWLGPLSRERAKKEFLNSHAFVLPSYYETFGVVFAEAIACGKPIIATKCGGPEVIVNQINGILVEIGDIQGIASGMEQMIKNYKAYRPELIRKDFESRFSKDAVLPQIVELYRSVVCAE